MSRKAVWFGTLVMGTALSGCAVAAHAPTFAAAKAAPPEEGMALVYIFRDRAQPTAWSATVYFDESKVATLKEDGFTWAYLAPGEHRVRAEWPWLSGQDDSSITLNVVPGETYYLELLGIARVTGVTWPVTHFQMGSGFIVLDPRIGEEAISRCCRFQPPAASRYPTGPSAR
jgi:uncharacterized protein DUF2846